MSDSSAPSAVRCISSSSSGKATKVVVVDIKGWRHGMCKSTPRPRPRPTRAEGRVSAWLLTLGGLDEERL